MCLVHDYELEPAAPARHVVLGPERRPETAPVAGAASLLHLQRVAGNQAVSAMLGEEVDEPSPVHQVVGSGGGSPLEPDVRSFMESRLGQDFSDVRVHTGPRADESARAVNAHAYTVGTDVVFRSGGYEPESDGGRRTLAHELTHVVQQRSGPVAGSPAPGGIRISDPGDPFEQAAERSADRVMAEPPPVQRAEEDELPEEETAQTLVAQRQAEEEELGA